MANQSAMFRLAAYCLLVIILLTNSSNSISSELCENLTDHPGICPEYHQKCDDLTEGSAEYRCDCDTDCGKGFKCCTDSCHQYKVCKSAVYVRDKGSDDDDDVILEYFDSGFIIQMQNNKIVNIYRDSSTENKVSEVYEDNGTPISVKENENDGIVFENTHGTTKQSDSKIIDETRDYDINYDDFYFPGLLHLETPTDSSADIVYEDYVFDNEESLTEMSKAIDTDEEKPKFVDSITSKLSGSTTENELNLSEINEESSVTLESSEVVSSTPVVLSREELAFINTDDEDFDYSARGYTTFSDLETDETKNKRRKFIRKNPVYDDENSLYSGSGGSDITVMFESENHAFTMSPIFGTIEDMEVFLTDDEDFVHWGSGDMESSTTINWNVIQIEGSGYNYNADRARRSEIGLEEQNKIMAESVASIYNQTARNKEVDSSNSDFFFSD